jgi:hypothetical protein
MQEKSGAESLVRKHEIAGIHDLKSNKGKEMRRKARELQDMSARNCTRRNFEYNIEAFIKGISCHSHIKLNKIFLLLPCG